MLLILLGLPGVGKSFIGKLLAEEYDFYHYEADNDLMPEIQQAICNKEFIPEYLREAFFNRVCQKIHQLQREGKKKIVVTQTFTKKRDRRKILENFPKAKFILIEAKTSLIKSRLLLRDNHPVNAEYALFALRQFEEPTIPYLTLTNNGNGRQIKTQLDDIFRILALSGYQNMPYDSCRKEAI